MNQTGNGAVAIWHDIAPEGRKEFYAWHGQEHMPERVGIPGFLRGRRYIALEADLEFFNLYETVSSDIVTGRDYLERLNSPTPWTQKTVKHFNKVSRSLCRVAASSGNSQGGLAMTVRYDVAEDKAENHIDNFRANILPDLVASGEIAAAHLLVADAAASAIKTAEQEVRTAKNVVPKWIAIIEGWGDQDNFSALCTKALSDERLGSLGATDPAVVGLYQHQLTVNPKPE